jgi:hypothetical protein
MTFIIHCRTVIDFIDLRARSNLDRDRSLITITMTVISTKTTVSSVSSHTLPILSLCTAAIAPITNACNAIRKTLRNSPTRPLNGILYQTSCYGAVNSKILPPHLLL